MAPFHLKFIEGSQIKRLSVSIAQVSARVLAMNVEGAIVSLFEVHRTAEAASVGA